MLTLRETDVLRLLANGCTYEQVADRLGISAHTVGSHIKNAYRKLEVHSAAAAVMRAVQLQLLLEPGHDLGDAGCRVGGDVDLDRAGGWLQGGELAVEE
jgi:DNA-binding CsgD family transcriptional regulator